MSIERIADAALNQAGTIAAAPPGTRIVRDHIFETFPGAREKEYRCVRCNGYVDMAVGGESFRDGPDACRSAP
jgi:hypothetical protein